MACASALTELVSGKTLEESRSLSRETVIAAVGGLPQASTHAAQLALDALSTALRQIRSLSMSSFHTVRRIACLQPSATVILDALGALGRVVACTRYCADVVPASGGWLAHDSRGFVDCRYRADRSRVSQIS